MQLKQISVEEIYTDRYPVTCKPSTKLEDVVKAMTENEIGAICIVDEDNKVVGIFTERDYIRNFKYAGFENFLTKEISFFMTPNPKTVLPDASVHQCLVLMRVNKFRHIIVVDEDNEPLKVISIRDALYHICDEVIYKA